MYTEKHANDFKILQLLTQTDVLQWMYDHWKCGVLFLSSAICSSGPWTGVRDNV